jgi:hypothetical protein
VSRLRRALVAITMATAAAGSGLLIAAAGAVPAYASASGSPAALAGAHKVTISAHPRAGAAGLGPRTILPCAVRPGVRPASCGDQTISCSITAATPFVTTAIREVDATAIVNCTSPVSSIALQESLLWNGNAVGQDSGTTQGKDGAATLAGAACQAGTWTNTASAFITFPPGYVLTGGTNPIHQTSASITVPTAGCRPVGGGGGGGGGGCAVHAPSLASHHPAGRHPDLIACG